MNFGATNGNYERNAVVKNPGNKTACTKKKLGDCWQWEVKRAVYLKETIAVFRHDINKRAKNDTVESVSEFFHAAE